MKKMTLANLKEFRDACTIPVTDEQLEADPYQPPYYHPGEDAEEIALPEGAAGQPRRLRSGAPGGRRSR